MIDVRSFVPSSLLLQLLPPLPQSTALSASPNGQASSERGCRLSEQRALIRMSTEEQMERKEEREWLTVHRVGWAEMSLAKQKNEGEGRRRKQATPFLSFPCPPHAKRLEQFPSQKLLSLASLAPIQPQPLTFLDDGLYSHASVIPRCSADCLVCRMLFT